jgi:hypothetical protein
MNNLTHNYTEPDPYLDGLVSQKLRIIKDDLSAHATGILTNIANNRGMRLISNACRAVRINDVHELVCTSQEKQPGEIVDEVGYLAFVVFDESGVVAIDDVLLVKGNNIGKVIGFNETHAPNHLNIIIQVDNITTGLQSGWEPGTKLVFTRFMSNEN